LTEASPTHPIGEPKLRIIIPLLWQ